MRSIARFLMIAWVALFVAAVIAKRSLVSRGGPDDDDVDLVAIMESFELASRATSFRGGTALTWFGGGTLDLRAATLHPDGARLTIRAMFGGLRLVVPPDWRVVHDVRAVFGGTGDARPGGGGSTDAARGPTLVVDGWAAFGGLGIVAEAPDLDAGAPASAGA